MKGITLNITGNVVVVIGDDKTKEEIGQTVTIGVNALKELLQKPKSFNLKDLDSIFASSKARED